MICGRCGGLVARDDLFCPRCGGALNAAPYGPPAGFVQPPAPYGAPPPPPHSRRGWVIAVVASVVVLAAGAVVGVVLATRDSSSTDAGAAPSTTTRPNSHPSAPTSSAAREDFASIYAREQSGVVRIEVLGCADSGIGSGFLLSPTLIATVDHVVTDSLVVSLVAGSQHTTGTVIGTDPAHDLALVRSDTPLSGYHFRFATTAPRIGDRVAAIGFPIGDPITLTQGGISGLDRAVSVEGTERAGLLETDAAVNPGNSGGPLLSADGSVVGLVDAVNTQANGIAYAVPYSQAEPQMTSWTRSPVPSRPAQCEEPLGPSQDTTAVPAIPGLSPEAAAGISTAFETYFDGINTGDYDSAWYVLSPRLRAGSSSESFADGDATSYDFDQEVLHAHQVDATTARVTLRFTSLQAPAKGPDGDSCDVWTLVYRMIDGQDGSWYIDATDPYHGRTHETC